MYKLTIERRFAAAHYLQNYDGKCANLHGHTWKVVVVLAGEKLINGMLVDFGDMKKLLDNMLPDHSCLNELYSFNPTAENLARHFYEILILLPGPIAIMLESVTVWESDTCSARYNP